MAKTRIRKSYNLGNGYRMNRNISTGEYVVAGCLGVCIKCIVYLMYYICIFPFIMFGKFIYNKIVNKDDTK